MMDMPVDVMIGAMPPAETIPHIWGPGDCDKCLLCESTNKRRAIPLAFAGTWACEKCHRR